MSMRVQDALSQGCEGVKNFASSAATWFGKTVSAAGTFIADFMSKVAEFVKPHFENLKTFVHENKHNIILATVGFAVGAILATIIANVFCKETGASQTQSSTAVSSSAATV